MQTELCYAYQREFMKELGIRETASDDEFIGLCYENQVPLKRTDCHQPGPKWTVLGV
jgi:hypothetical protein